MDNIFEIIFSFVPKDMYIFPHLVVLYPYMIIFCKVVIIHCISQYSSIFKKKNKKCRKLIINFGVYEADKNQQANAKSSRRIFFFPVCNESYSKGKFTFAMEKGLSAIFETKLFMSNDIICIY